MKEAIKKLLARQRELLAAAEAEQRELTADEQREFDTAQMLIDAYNAQEGDSRSEGEGGQGGTPTETPTPEERQGGGYTPEDAAEINNMCRHFGVDAGDILARGLTPAQAASELVRQQMENNPPLSRGIEVTDDEGDKFRRSVTDGILLRGGISLTTPAEGANAYRTMSIRDIAIECMERGGDSADYRHMNSDDLFSAVSREFFNPASAFPAIMDEAIKKSYVEGLAKANVSYDKWVKTGTLPNFKKTTNHEYIMSLSGELEEVPENGELKSYVPKDVAMPERQLKTFGKQFTMSRQAFINDDIGVLTSMPHRYAVLTQRTQNTAVYNILMKNKNIYDGKPLFSTARKNTLSTGTLPTLDSISKMIYMIGIQKDIAGNQLALVPDLFIVPFGMGMEVRKILGSPTTHTAENTQAMNPYYNANFTVVEDVFLNGMVKEGEPLPWFMGVKERGIQVDYLNGKKEATIRRSEKSGMLGFIWDVFFDFGVSVIHPEALVRNPGVALDLGE